MTAALFFAAVLGLMPALPVENLKGERLVAPRDAIYVVTFTRDASAQGAEWSAELRKAFPQRDVFQVAIIDDVPGFARSFVTKQIRSGIPENMRGNFFVAKEKGAEWRKAVSFSRPELAYVIVATPQGQIHWRSSGKFDAARLAELAALGPQYKKSTPLTVIPPPR